MNKPAIIVPYRDRLLHKSIFIPAMKKYMPNADIIVVEQADSKPFNRAKLLNAGVIMSSDFGDYSYYIFHDVDKIPVRVDYSFPSRITQLEKSNIQIKDYFGGVTMFNGSDFHYVDGYSNNFWGWGGEDNEQHNRVKGLGLQIDYRDSVFRSLPHKKNGTFDKQKWEQAQKPREPTDGLRNCKYELISKDQEDGYTLLKVKL